MQDFDIVSAYSTAEQVNRLQQELELLRLKDLQQAHHIHMLTQQLRSSHAEHSQPVANPRVLQSSVSAKWQEWRQRRSQSPEPFQRPLSQKLQQQPGQLARPATRESRSPVKATHNGPVFHSSARHAQPHLPHSNQRERAGSSPTQNQAQYQISAAMGASGKLSRSEHRWYQPTQASDRAAALTHEALAAAAAEQELDQANWLLKSAPVGRSRSAQRCTFGSELRWWERVNQARPSASGHHDNCQAAMHTAEDAHELRYEYRGQQIRHGSPPRGHSLPRQGSTFGSEPRFWSSPAAEHASKQQSSPVAAALAAAAAGGSMSMSMSGLPSAIPLTATPSQRSVSVDRGLRQSQVAVASEQAWWAPDPAPSPDSALQRIQQKHAQIQSLAAVINQRPTSARTHTVKSTFGSEARWWERPATEKASALSSQPDQRPASARRVSPERSSAVQCGTHQVSTPDSTSAHKLHSTFGSQRRWWEPSTAAASLPQLQDPVAMVGAAMWSPRQRSASPDPVKSKVALGKEDNWWLMSQERPSLHGSLPEERSSSSMAAQSKRAVSAAVVQPPPPSYPHFTATATQQEQVEDLHAQAWTQHSPVQLKPQESDAQFHTGSEAKRGSMTQSAGGGGSAGSLPRSTASVRSRSLSPIGSLQRSQRYSRRSSSKSELQESLRHRSTERQRLEHVRSPHASDWAQSLRDPMPEFQRRDSRKEARELQEEFLQKARQDLEAFQQVSSPMQRLPQAAAQPASQTWLEDAATSLDIDQQPVDVFKERPRTTLENRLSRGMRQGSRGPGQGGGWQGSSRRLSRQDSTKKVAIQRQQQQLAAQQAEVRLAAFQEAAERHNAEAAQRRQEQAAAKAASPVVAKRASNARAAAGLMATPVKLTGRSSLPSSYAPPPVQQASPDRNLLRSVSWAQQSELQEPPHEDSFEAPHMPASHLPAVPCTPAMLPVTLPCIAIHQGAAMAVGSDQGLHSGGGFQSRKEALDAYYKAKQTAVESGAQSTATSAAPEARAAVMEPGMQPPPVTEAASATTLGQVGGAEKIVGTSALRMRFVPSAPAPSSSNQVIVGPPARRVSLVLPQPAQAQQPKTDAFSPGKPGLKSQLSKMMEEVAQARNEMQGLQSQLSVHSRLGPRSGSSTASSVAGSDQVLDGV